LLARRRCRGVLRRAVLSLRLRFCSWQMNVRCAAVKWRMENPREMPEGVWRQKDLGEGFTICMISMN